MRDMGHEDEDDDDNNNNNDDDDDNNGVHVPQQCYLFPFFIGVIW